MAAFLQDSFTHVGTQVNLNTHSPEVGGAWVTGGGRWRANTNTIFIYGTGRARSTNTSGQSLAYNDELPPSADVKITALIGRQVDSTSSMTFLYWRGSLSVNNAYRLTVDETDATLHKIVAGVTTQIGVSAPGTGTPGISDATYEILHKGGTISVSRNGDLILSVDDSDILDNGYVGFGTRSNGYIDSIEVEDGAGGPSPTTGAIEGAATVTGLSIATREAAGTITAGAASSFISQTFRTGYGQSIGVAVVNGIGITLSFAEATGAITTGATVNGVGRSVRAGVGEAGGAATSSWTATGLTVGESEGTITAGAEVIGIGGRVMTAGSSITGRATSNMIGRALAETAGVIEGVAEVLGVGAAFDLGMTDGTISAGATVNGVGETIINTVGTIASSATVTGKVVSGSVSRINGRATVTGRSLQIRSTTGTAAGSTGSNMIGSQFEGSQGVARGASDVMGVGHAIVATVGEITGTSDSYFLSFGVTAFITPADRTIEVPAEDRAVIVLGEDRAIIVPLSDTSAAAERQSRTIEVIAENRAIEVIAEDRTLTVNPENREIIL